MKNEGPDLFLMPTGQPGYSCSVDTVYKCTYSIGMNESTVFHVHYINTECKYPNITLRDCRAHSFRSATLRKFMGEARMNEIIGVSESSYSCEEVFSGDVCPWHPNTSKKVIAKLILNSDLDMATLANLAVQGAKAFSS